MLDKVLRDISIEFSISNKLKSLNDRNLVCKSSFNILPVVVNKYISVLIG